MRAFLALAARHTVFANLMVIIVLAAGGIAGSGLVRELFPTFSADSVTVGVVYPGATPEEVEEGICLKIEEAIEGLQGVKRYYTAAAEGAGTAVIELEEGLADPRKVENDIRDRVEAIKTFPLDAEKPITTEILLRRRVINVSLSGTAGEDVLREMAENIKDELIARPGISQVQIEGIRQPEIAIEISEERLRAFGLRFDEVAAAVRRGALNLPGGTIRSRHGEIKIRALGRRYRAAEFADLVVLAAPDGRIVRLADIATLRDTFEEVNRYGAQDGRRAVLLAVFKTEDEDAIAISRRVRAYVEAKNRTLPGDLHLTPWYDTSKFIADRLNLLLRNGRMGLVLVFASLWLLLGLRLSFWVALGIPVSFAGALAIMAATGQTLNMISMFGLIMTLGIIVDDAIIVGEAIARARERGAPPLAAAVRGVTEVAWPVVAAVTTTIVAFLPLFFVKGMMGKFIAVMPAVVVAALVTSLIESLFLLPAHLNHLPDPRRSDPRHAGRRRLPAAVRATIRRGFEALIERIYRPFLAACIRARYLTLAVMAAVFALTLGTVLGGHVKFVLFPKTDSELITASVEFPAGTPVEVTQRALDRLTAAIQAVDAHERKERGTSLTLSIWAAIGGRPRFRPGVAPAGDNAGYVLAQLVPTEARRVHSEEVIRAWREEIGAIPDALSLKVASAGGGPGGDAIEIRLLGEDTRELAACAREIEQAIGSYRGVEDIADDFRPGKRELRVRLKPAARTLGLELDDLARQLRQGWYGDEALRIQRGRDDVRVKIRYPLGKRRSLGELDAIRIRTRDGREIPFGEVAEARIERGFATITRQDGLRRVVVTADVDQEIANAEEILAKFRRDELPPILAHHKGVTATFEGQSQERRESLGSLTRGFVFAALGIFLILATIFRSYVQPFVIMVTIPMGFVGAVIGHLVMGFDLSMMSMFGFVALAGIVVNDAIVLTERFNENLAEGAPFQRALLDAGCRRFRAITLTTITTSLGLLPLIAERSFQAQYLIPMAISIAFGVAFATLLTLVVLPALLAAVNDLRRSLRWLVRGRAGRPEEVEPGARRRLPNGEGTRAAPAPVLAGVPTGSDAREEPGSDPRDPAGRNEIGGAGGLRHGAGPLAGILLLAGIGTMAMTGCALVEPRLYAPGPLWEPDAPGRAEEHEAVTLPRVLTLQRAREIANERSPTLHAAFARVEAARARVAQALAAYLPRVDARSGYEHLYEIPGISDFPWLPDEYDVYRTALEGSWLVFDGLAREFRLAAARWGERESRAAHEDARRLLRLAVDGAYHEAQLAGEALRIARADERYNEELAEETRKREAAGAASRTETLNFEVRAQAARAAVAAAEKDLATRRIVLAELLGLPGARLAGATRLEPLAEEAPAMLEPPEAARWLEWARAARPDLARSRYALERARADVRQAATAWFPSLTLTGGYGRVRVGDMRYTPDDASSSLAVALGWNLFAGGEKLAALREARAAAREAEADADGRRLTVDSEVRQAIAAVEEGQRQVGIERRSLELATRTRDLVRREYEAGQASLTRLNEVQRDFVQADARLASARVRLRHAWSLLEAAAGRHAGP